MKIGYACLALGTAARTNHGFVFRNLTRERFISAVAENLQGLQDILSYNLANGILLFRISSDIIPFGSHLAMDYPWPEIFRTELAAIGSFVRRYGMRLSMHPGQYTVLNSPDPRVAENARRDLEYHQLFLAALGLGSDCKIVIHTGGVYGDKTAAMARFAASFRQLSPETQSRLVLENDDRSFAITDVLEIASQLEIPAVFDCLHHRLKPPGENFSLDKILPAVKNTWRPEDGAMKIHYSESAADKRNGSHSQTVSVDNFLAFLPQVAPYAPDIMLEVKDKDLSAIKVINALKTPISAKEKTDLWARYKYTVMEKSYAHYKSCSRVINSSQPLADFFRLVDRSLLAPADPGSFINAAQHVWGYYKDRVSEKERQQFGLLCQNRDDLAAVKKFLQKIAGHYPNAYIDRSYYFLY